MFTTASRAQRSSTFGAVLAILFGLLMFASPAQAAPALNLTAASSTITLGDAVNLTWTAGELERLEATGDWSGPKLTTGGSESVTPTHLGSNVFNLTSEVVDGRPGPTATVTVNVVAPEPVVTPVTPAAVTFPGECTVVVPSTTGVKYTVSLDGETTDVDPGTYEGSDFFGEDDQAIFKAVALDGFVIADGATASWSYDAFDDCFAQNDELVSAKASCSAVTFSNLTDEVVRVFYGGPESDFADGDFTIAAGTSRKVSTSRDELLFVALIGPENTPRGIQIDQVSVSQNCGGDVSDSNDDNDVDWPVKIPTRAPAAGVIAEEGGPSLPLMAVLGALALIAVRGRYNLGR